MNRRKSRLPTSPPFPDRGLASAHNAHVVRTILQRSLPEEIAELLKEVGYRPQDSRPSRSDAASGPGHRKPPPVIDQTEVSRQRQQLTMRAAREFVDSTKGQAAVEHAKAVLISRDVLADDDVVNRLCKDAALRFVQDWIGSPRGREAIRQLAARMIEEQLHNLAPVQKRTWLDARIKDLTRDDHCWSDLRFAAVGLAAGNGINSQIDSGM